jgi:hypothetical protein
MSTFRIEKVRVNDENNRLGEIGAFTLGPRERDWVKSWAKAKKANLKINGSEVELSGNITVDDVKNLKALLKDYRKSSNIGFVDSV